MIGQKIIRMETVHSTNTFLLEHPEYLEEHGLVLLTHQQLAGRGRHQRSYVSLPGKNLTFSVVLHPQDYSEDIGLYSLLAGLAVCHTLQPYLSIVPKLKWPNDVLIDNKKVCGVLIDITSAPTKETPILVLGIGINCHGSSADYPEELQPSLTTLEEYSSKSIELEDVFQQTLVQLELLLAQLQQKGGSLITDEWLSYSQSMGAYVRYEDQGGWSQGMIEGLSPEGFLLLRKESGERVVHTSGDVLFL